MVEYQRVYQKTPQGRQKTRERTWKQYGINFTVEAYDAVLSVQGGVCALCRRPPAKKLLAVDHDHRTGRIRGLLCVQCNTGLGKLGDTVEALERALAYLQRNS